MAQGTFVQALRKEAALSGTFMKGRSLMLNGAVLSIEDSGSRFSKNVTVEGSVRGSRGDLYKTHVRSIWTSTRLSTTTATAPPHTAIPVCASTPSPQRWRTWTPAALSLLRGCARRFARLRRSRTARAWRVRRAGRQPQLSLPGARPHRARALWRRFPILSARAWMSWRACAASLPVPLIPTPPKRRWSLVGAVLQSAVR